MDSRMKLLAFALIAVISIGLLTTVNIVDLNKEVKDDFDLGSSATCSVVANFYGYYEGEKVAIPVVAAPWEIEGLVVDSLGVTISWTVTGEYMDWTTLEIDGTLRLYRGDYTGQAWTEITSNVDFSTHFTRGGETNLVGSVDYTLPLVDLLSSVAKSGLDYWIIKATVEVSGSATDDYGLTTEETTGLLSVIYTIYDATGGWEISGVIE